MGLGHNQVGGDDSRPAPDLPTQLAGQGVVIPVRGIGKGVPRAGVDEQPPHPGSPSCGGGGPGQEAISQSASTSS